ncbi:TPA: hypothetical protein EYP44_01860 [Candidatus Bathyarchaeota archaeon]|nr:hypothetical protein [Candidatus Bathyarchaeota archaeon]
MLKGFRARDCHGKPKRAKKAHGILKENEQKGPRMPYRKLQAYIEYKANLEGIEVRFVKARNASRTCHRSGTLPEG